MARVLVSYRGATGAGEFSAASQGNTSRAFIGRKSQRLKQCCLAPGLGSLGVNPCLYSILVPGTQAVLCKLHTCNSHHSYDRDQPRCPLNMACRAKFAPALKYSCGILHSSCLPVIDVKMRNRERLGNTRASSQGQQPVGARRLLLRAR